MQSDLPLLTKLWLTEDLHRESLREIRPELLERLIRDLLEYVHELPISLMCLSLIRILNGYEALAIRTEFQQMLIRSSPSLSDHRILRSPKTLSKKEIAEHP